MVRTVVFGGGTGLSSIVGGETESERWALEPFLGLKRYFSSLQIVVCMTDDGGSSGKILQSLPCIALGDIRRAALSAISPIHIITEYPSLHQDNFESLVRFLQKTRKVARMLAEQCRTDPVLALLRELRLFRVLVRNAIDLARASGQAPAAAWTTRAGLALSSSRRSGPHQKL